MWRKWYTQILAKTLGRKTLAGSNPVTGTKEEIIHASTIVEINNHPFGW